jgi:light-independent protochlorophyllide reductase subunit B
MALAATAPAPAFAEPETAPVNDGALVWTAEAERELKKIPFFVRGKAKRNTEAFAAAEGRRQIDLDTLYDAKAHYAR